MSAVNPDLISIEDASERTGLSPEDIEYAEQNGLLAYGREAEGYYTPVQLKSLETIARLRELGLSIEEIRDLELPEDMLAEIQEYLEFPRRDRPSFDLSCAFIQAGIHVLTSHERVVCKQIEQLGILKRDLGRRISTLRKLLRVFEQRARRAA